MQKTLSISQRTAIAEKLIELANLTVVALVVAQAFDSEIRELPLIIGLVGYAGLFSIAIKIMKGGEGESKRS